jgi:hypothetical protein
VAQIQVRETSILAQCAKVVTASFAAAICTLLLYVWGSTGGLHLEVLILGFAPWLLFGISLLRAGNVLGSYLRPWLRTQSVLSLASVLPLIVLTSAVQHNRYVLGPLDSLFAGIAVAASSWLALAPLISLLYLIAKSTQAGHASKEQKAAAVMIAIGPSIPLIWLVSCAPIAHVTIELGRVGWYAAIEAGYVVSFAGLELLKRFEAGKDSIDNASQNEGCACKKIRRSVNST